MRTKECEHEAKVALAVRTGEWEDSLRRHASECHSCHELATVAQWMRTLARSSGADPAVTAFTEYDSRRLSRDLDHLPHSF